MAKIRKEPVDKWIIDPMRRFLSNSSMSGIVLFSSALIAIILSNSPWAEEFHHFWETKISVGLHDWQLSKSLHHWINDGLMAIFFFVVGLELKREIISGELSNPKAAMLPIAAALGGMLVPAMVYFALNPSGETSGGWGIPMATDIAFALGILYLLGDKVPVSLKIFLTALAITDDLGAVLVIAFFYTSDINLSSLLVAGIFLIILILANRTGVRNTLFYGLVGIGGLWLAFLMSGVHATIAAVLAAFTIPANAKISEELYSRKLSTLLERFKKAKPNNSPTVTTEQLHILEEIRYVSEKALTPLQRLEHAMHPFVSFVVMPLFALANAGISLSADSLSLLGNSITLGVFFGLVIGKVIGILGFTTLVIKLKWAAFPEGITRRHLIGAGFLAGIGFTMSLFISQLAFENPLYIEAAKIGILLASLTAGTIGYLIISSSSKSN